MNNLFDSMEVETAFEELVKRFNYKKEKQSTGIESVLQIMIENETKIWWMAWEFIGKTTSKGQYLSYRSPARASDLAIHYSEFMEDRKIGRFKAYRLRKENIEKIRYFLATGEVVSGSNNVINL